MRSHVLIVGPRPSSDREYYGIVMSPGRPSVLALPREIRELNDGTPPLNA